MQTARETVNKKNNLKGGVVGSSSIKTSKPNKSASKSIKENSKRVFYTLVLKSYIEKYRISLKYKQSYAHHGEML